MTTQEILKLFCGSERDQKAYRQPWTHGGNTFATNGKIGVEVFGVHAELPTEKVPDMLKLFLAVKHPYSAPLVGIEIEKKTEKCQRCKGCGKSAQCQGCDGEGDHICSCGDSHECRECHGTGWVMDHEEECEKCGGTGTAEVVQPIPINAVECGSQILISSVYLGVALSLPGATRISWGDVQGPALVDFDGGRALFMAMVR